MTGITRKSFIAAACIFSINASAAVFCPAPFDFKGMQDGVMYGDCSCNGQRLFNVTRQQCDAAVEKLTRTQHGSSPQERAAQQAQQGVYRPGSMMAELIAAHNRAASAVPPAK
ncbi:hypothetical protein [Burkholderia pseudomultivorans]|uniref:hypothetical protein n=1 Tax=Burkholderia pseudomultivorans TaxID=1207504 RepID=UPI0012D9736B|nr:hypothetical protein [Burkholderia pseudomultivorans]